MSALASVEAVLEVKQHPNADRLDIAQVLGFECVVGRDSCRPGDLVVFIQPDTVLPADKAWASEVLKYTKSGGRVRATRLRGEWSMGLVMPLGILDEPASLGEDVAERLGVTAYEAPLPRNLQAKGGLPFGIPKTDEERWQNVRDLELLMGREVDVTLKIDGSSFMAFCVLPGDHPGDETLTGITSRSLELKMLEDGTNQWLEAARMTGVVDLLRGYCEKWGVSLALRGEVYGRGVQSLAINPHSKLDRGVAFFSVWNIRERRYEGSVHRHYFVEVCQELDLPTVPILENKVPLNRDLIARYDHEIDQIDSQPYEGVVVKGDTFSFKITNKSYDSQK